MAEEIKKLVDEYRDGKLSRREFMHKAILLTGSLAAATSLAACAVGAVGESEPAQPDAALVSTNVQYPGKAGTIYGYLTRPSAAGKYPAIIIISDNAGLGDHFRDVGRRYAKEGYLALVPDVFSRHGGTAKVNPKGTGISNFRELAPDQAMTEDIESGFAYLKRVPEVRADRLGLTGFCWGGDMAFGAATQVRGIKALVIYYTRSPQPLERLKNLEAPVLASYAGEDPGVNQGIPATEAAMKKYNKSYTYKIYPGAKHAFFHDGRADRYNAEAAKDAWSRTLEFFKKNLQS